MTDYVFAVCSSGHLIDSEEYDKAAIEEMDVNSSITATTIQNPDYSITQNYCPDCGGQILTQCTDCGATIRGEIPYTDSPSEGLIPSFCSTCGESFPWTTTVESEKQRDSEFIQLDDADIDGHFYPGLIYEINLCYKVKADQAALVLNRKLIENLIADSLRAAFGMNALELFYDQEEGRIHSLSVLVDNMKEKQSELQRYASIEEDFFKAIEEMKYHGDASAHSIEEHPTQENVTEKSETATSVVKVLFRLRNEAKTAHRNR
ncbi:DUF2321 domain-containing protein [Salarchaeum sp. III]|uniref:DUF2321 domain-containing protein n=1 Tax=Salarchaeum sp. III TaxID=3107927 RepID=UPI002ED8CF1E